MEWLQEFKKINNRGKLMKSPRDAFQSYTMTSPGSPKNTEDIILVKKMMSQNTDFMVI